MKTAHAAVVAIPPQDVWAPIQAIRERYDRHLQRWMPHVTLLYPFRPRAMFDQAEPALRRACAALPSFAATLGELRFFPHGRDRFTIWLAPEPAESFVRLQRALQEQFPDCDDASRHGSGFVPHLSVGQATGRDQLAERLTELRAGWRQLAFEVRAVALIWREGEEPFQVDRSVPLG